MSPKADCVGSALEGLGMTGTVRGQYTLEFKQEAVRLVRGGQATFSVARTLGISGQKLHNWVKAEAAGGVGGDSGKESSGGQKVQGARAKTDEGARPLRTRQTQVQGDDEQRP